MPEPSSRDRRRRHLRGRSITHGLFGLVGGAAVAALLALLLWSLANGPGDPEAMLDAVLRFSLLVGAAGFAWPWLRAWRQGKRAASLEARLRREGVAAEVHPSDDGGQIAWTVEWALEGLPDELTLQPPGLVRLGRGVETGDAAFDKVTPRGGPDPLVLAIFDAELRTGLTPLLKRFPLWVRDGRAWTTLPHRTSADAVHRHAGDLDPLLPSLRLEPDRVPERLAARVRGETGKARRLALEALLPAWRDTDVARALVDDLSASNDQIGLALAAARLLEDTDQIARLEALYQQRRSGLSLVGDGGGELSQVKADGALSRVAEPEASEP